MSDTPLTDASISQRTAYASTGFGHQQISMKVDYVEVSDCRAIERDLNAAIEARDIELAAAQARIAELIAWQEKVQMELVWPLQEKVAELEAERERVRAAALEEAAKEMDFFGHRFYAERIRSLAARAIVDKVKE